MAKKPSIPEKPSEPDATLTFGNLVQALTLIDTLLNASADPPLTLKGVSSMMHAPQWIIALMFACGEETPIHARNPELSKKVRDNCVALLESILNLVGSLGQTDKEKPPSQ